MNDFINLLPEECKDIAIADRHKVALEHRTVGDYVWVVLLTKMPGDCPKAWQIPKAKYWKLEPKHGTRDRYIRENYKPILEGRQNPQKIIQESLF